MDEPLPLNIPPSLDYVSLGPYTVSFEWGDPAPNAVAFMCIDLRSALGACYHPSVPLGEPHSPFRRIVVDARGITVWGWLEAACEPSKRTVGTFETLNFMRSLPLGESTAAEMDNVEMEMLWATS